MKSAHLHLLALTCFCATLLAPILANAQHANSATNEAPSERYGAAPSESTAKVGEALKYLEWKEVNLDQSSQKVDGFMVQDFTCKQVADQVQLTWVSLNELGVKEYIVERSADGNTFSYIGTVTSESDGEDRIYGLVDDSPLNGFSYYCLTSVTDEGKRVCWGFTKNRMERDPWIRVWPNPSSGQGVNMEIQFMEGDHVSWRIIDQTGKLVREDSRAEVLDGNWKMHIGGESDGLDRGTYMLQINGSSQAFCQTFVVY